MKIIVIGGTGTIGNAVVEELAKRHDIIVAGYHRGDVQVDMKNPESIKKMYSYTGKIDGVVTTVGKVHFGPIAEMNADQYQVGLQDKLMGQVNVVLLGLPYLNDGGSFTLTKGIDEYFIL